MRVFTDACKARKFKVNGRLKPPCLQTAFLTASFVFPSSTSELLFSFCNLQIYLMVDKKSPIVFEYLRLV